MAVAGLTLQVLLLVVIVPIGLVAPLYGIVVIQVAWLGGAIVAWRRRSNLAVVLAVPFATAALVAGILWFGGAVLGWQP